MPDTAIATDQSRKIVFVVKADDTVEARAVTLGPLDDGLRVIREGLKPDDRVIVDGLQRARVGAKVSPHEANLPVRKPRRPVTRHESRRAFHQPADPGDGAVDRAADRGHARLPDAAGRRISRSGAADGGRHRAISGRIGADHFRYRRRADRAADQRRRGHAVHVQPGDLERPAHHHRHLQARHRSRQGAGAGAEPRRDRAAAIAGRSAAQRRRHQEELARHPDGRVHAVAGRQPRPALHLELRAAAGSRPVAAARRHRRHPDFRRPRLFDAAVARSRQDRQPRHDLGRRDRRDPRPEFADHRRSAWPARRSPTAPSSRT